MSSQNRRRRGHFLGESPTPGPRTLNLTGLAADPQLEASCSHGRSPGRGILGTSVLLDAGRRGWGGVPMASWGEGKGTRGSSGKESGETGRRRVGSGEPPSSRARGAGEGLVCAF